MNFNGQNAQMGPISGMLAALRRRGPDDQGQWKNGPVALGHRRLAILDLSLHGHQPMQLPGQPLAIVFNGTIYNFRELRSELQALGHVFDSDGDTEVILKAYWQWGSGCLAKLRGMFAFAIYDNRQQDHLVFLARDRLGIKPLYYSLSGQQLAFASTLPALLAGGIEPGEIDPLALHYHLTLHASVPAPHTLFQNIRKLKPASYLLFDRQGLREEKTYWQIPLADSEKLQLPDSVWQQLIAEELAGSVQLHHTVSDVPVGVLLSGGLDSSLLAALLASKSAEQILTFSVGFEDAPEEKGSEFEFSDQVARRWQTRHHRYVIKNSQVLERLPEAVDNMSEPMVAQDAVAFYLLAEQVAREVKVVLSGQGADEVFAGYFWYPLMQEARGHDLERFRPYYFDRSHQEFLQTVDSRFHQIDHTSGLVESLLQKSQSNFDESFLARVLRADVSTFLVDDPVKRVDNMTMAWGLEARVPFLDHVLVEKAFALPDHMKLRGGNGKYVLKEIARPLLPASVIDRPKGYFPVPALKYVRGGFYDFMQDILLSEKARARRLFNPAYVKQLLAEPEKHMTALQGSKLWHLALLEFWLQRHLP